MSKITDRVFALAKPVVENEGCSLWDVEYVREAGSWYLRVYIDKEGGITINDCEAVARQMNELLDQEDFIHEPGSVGERLVTVPERAAQKLTFLFPELDGSTPKNIRLYGMDFAVPHPIEVRTISQ